MSGFTTLIECSAGSPSHSNQAIKEIKGIWNRNEQVKLSLFADDKMLYIENPKDSTEKLFELINEFSKVAGNKL